MKDARALFTYAMLALGIFVAYQGYQNSRPLPDTLALSRSHACDLEADCIVVGHRRGRGERADVPTVVKTDFVRRRYEWETNNGPVIVTCKRGQVFLGAWKCTTERGELVVTHTSNRTF